MLDVVAGHRDWWVEQGDALETLRQLPDGCVSVCATSPPYFNLRSYLPADDPDKALEVGLERSLVAYVERLVVIFREVRRVLHPTGTAWVALGDSYATNPGNGRGGEGVRRGSAMTGGVPHRSGRDRRGMAKPKDLLGVPWEVAFALRTDGWYLRSDIIWAKTACMPESVTDRPTSSHEHVFLLAKQARYYYDADAVREPNTEGSLSRHAGGIEAPYDEAYTAGRHGHRPHGGRLNQNGGYVNGRNQRNVWTLGPEPLADDHYAAWPTEIPRRAILAGSSEKGVCPECGAPWERVVELLAPTKRWGDGAAQAERNKATGRPGGAGCTIPLGSAGNAAPRQTIGWEPTCDCGHCLERADGRHDWIDGADICSRCGTDWEHRRPDPIPALVLDPFSGSGRTVLTALNLGRRAIGIELSGYQAQKSRDRIVGDKPMFNQEASG